MHILVTGATGFIGKNLVKNFLNQGFRVTVLTRNSSLAAMSLGSKCNYFQLNLENSKSQIDEKFYSQNFDAIVNLAGENIAKLCWNDETKKKLYNSRIDITNFLVQSLNRFAQAPKVFISASAIGVYGETTNEGSEESANLGEDFLAYVCRKWEESSKQVEMVSSNTRLAILRIGVVLGKNGGSIAKMLPPFKMGLGGPLGSGEQFMSWIHIKDLVQLINTALKNDSYSGFINAVSPFPCKNKDFTATFAKTLGKPAFFRVPLFVLEMLMGEASNFLTYNSKIIPKVLKEKDFHFNYPTVDLALKDIFSNE